MPSSKSNNKSRHQPATDTQKTDTRARLAERDLNARQREAQVMTLRVQGWSFARIAEQVGYSDQGGAYKAWKRALARIPKAAADEAREHLRLQLEDMSEILHMQLRKGNTRAGEALIKLQERYCRMLNLDIQPDTTAGAGLALVSVPIAADVLEAV
jgi:AraC-like DNA-binding protein